MARDRAIETTAGYQYKHFKFSGAEVKFGITREDQFNAMGTEAMVPGDARAPFY